MPRMFDAVASACTFSLVPHFVYFWIIGNHFYMQLISNFWCLLFSVCMILLIGEKRLQQSLTPHVVLLFASLFSTWLTLFTDAVRS